MFIILIVLAILALIAYGVSFALAVETSMKDHPRKYARYTALGLAALSLLLFFVGSIKTVGTKDVGIVTSFGRTSGELSPGIHFTAPWQNVTSMDAAIQTDTYKLNARIANQQVATVSVSIRWRISTKGNSADSLFQNYRTFDHVRDSLVTRELTSAVNTQFANYNPLNSVQGASGGTNASYLTIANLITKQMQQSVGSQVEILSTIVPFVSFDDQTQARINQLQQQVALTRVAEQSIQTNQDQAKANQALAASVNNNPALNTANCLNIVATAVKDNYSGLPAGFSCFGGSTATITASGK